MDPQPLTRRHLIILAVILAVGLLLRSWHLAALLQSPLAHEEIHSTSSDMHAFTHVARLMAEGDWLCETGYHPFMDWMGQIAPIEKFEEWWGGKEIYHQTPLYPYGLAVCYLLFDSNVPLLILQVLGSVLGLWLLFELGRRFLDPRAGLIAAGLGALFAPAIVLDAIQLRASLNTTFSLLSVWLLLRLAERRTLRLAILTGVCLASSYLLRPTGLALLLLGPAFLCVDRTMRSEWKRWLPPLAVAAVVVLAPFFVRNAVVGAPLLSLSTRGPETMIQAQGSGADPGFMSMTPAVVYRTRMEAGHGSMLRALSTSIDTWPGGLSDWLWHQWQKVKCVFGDYEYANNINFYWYREYTPLLRYLPTFGWFVGFGLVGMILLAVFGRDRRFLWIPLAAAGALVMGCQLGFALGRYRMPLAVMLCLPAGATLSLLWTWLQSRQRLVTALVVAAASLALCAMSFFVLPAHTVLQQDGLIELHPRTRAIYLELTKRRHQECTSTAARLQKAGRSAEAIRTIVEFGSRYMEFFERSAERIGSDGRYLETRLKSASDSDREAITRELGGTHQSYHQLLNVSKRRLQILAATLHELGETTYRDRFAGVIAVIDQQLNPK